MCHFALLLFISQVGGFNFYVPETYKAVESACPVALVSAQNRYQTFRSESIAIHPQDFIQPSFQRFEAFASDPTRDHHRNGSDGTNLSVALPMRQFEWQKGASLLHLRSSLDVGDSAFQRSKAAQFQSGSPTKVGPTETAQTGPTMGAAMGAAGILWRWGAMGEVAETTPLSASLKLQQTEAKQRKGQRQTPGQSASGYTPGPLRSRCASWTTSSFADVSGGPVAYGSSTALASWQFASRSQHSGCHSTSSRCGSQVALDVCSLGKASRWPPPRYTEGDQRCKDEGGRSGNQIPSQTGQCIGKGKSRAAACECSQVELAFILEVVPGRAGCQVASLFPAVSDPGSQSLGESGCSPGGFGHSAFQSSCIKVASPEDGSVVGAGHPDCQRRRGGIQGVQRSSQLQCSENHGQPSAFGRKLEDAQCQRRRIDDCRAKGKQTTAHRPSSRSFWTRFSNVCCAVFSLGRIGVTTEYAVQRPVGPSDLPAQNGFTEKWTHPVVHEFDFCSEWAASHRATELALQLGVSTFHPPIANTCRRRKPVGSLSVTFCSYVEVCIGEVDSIQMHSVTVPSEVLDTCDKPWSNQWTPSGSSGIRGTFDYTTDLGCPVECLFESFSFRAPVASRCAQSYVILEDSRNVGSCLPGSFPSFVPVLEPISGDVGRDAASCSPRTLIDKPPSVEGGLYDGNLLCSLDSCCDPLSPEAVSIPGFFGSFSIAQTDDQNVDTSISEGSFPFLTSGMPMVSTSKIVVHPDSSSRRSGTVGPGSQSSAPSQSSAGPSVPPVPPVPSFATGILTSLPLEYQTRPVRIVQGILVRSWLIHHVTLPRSLQSRQCMLQGPPHTWRDQLIAVWFGANIPQEAVSVDLIKPIPPRNWHETSVLFDVVLAQGLESDRVAGLVTVLPTFQHAVLSPYSVAVSFAPLLSGQDVVTQADIQDLCNLYECLIFHEAVFLPIDFNRHFQTIPGVGFVVYVNSRTESPAEAVALTLDAQDPAPEPETNPAEDMDLDLSPTAAPDDGAVFNGRVSPQPRTRRRVIFYRVGGLPISAWVQSTSFDGLITEVLGLMAIQPAELVSLHQVRAKPVGEAFHETSFIIQRQSDMPPGSPDQLVLLDVVFHQHGPVTAPLAASQFDRRVVRLPAELSRVGLLSVARVANYCESRRNCVVMVDHALWPVQQGGNRHLRHGTYCRIHVPPPAALGMETCRVVSWIESLCDPSDPRFEHVYPFVNSHVHSNTRSHLNDEHAPQNALIDALATTVGQPRQHHAPEGQNVEPPSFEAPVPAQAAPVFPNVPDWLSFETELRLILDEFGHIDIPEEGPVLHVITWYIHHGRRPSCLVGRLVRLSQRPVEWLQLLCTPWLPVLQPFENLAFHLVRPNPTPDIPGQHVIHVILEQDIQIARRTALISALFHGLHGDVTHRRAQSIPTHLSREVVERLLSIEDVCRLRRCTAWSGRLQFHRHRLEPVSQGIGINLVVAPFRNRFAQVDDDGYPIHDSASSSVIPPRMSFRPDDATLFPHSRDAMQDVGVLPEHAPSRLIPDLRVIWEQYLMSAVQRPFRFYIETWFCDHDRFPRTDRSREVLLPPDQDSWKQAILDKWQDMIDPAVDVLLYVVAPQPIGGASDILAHVLLAQHQHRGFISALITTLAPGDDPWDPPRVALKLPAVVDKALLIQESGLFPFCPPFMPFNVCRAHIGDVDLFQDQLRDSQSGDGFLCVAEALPVPLNAENLEAPDTLHGRHVEGLFGMLGRIITSIVAALNHSVSSTPEWTAQNIVLDQQLADEQIAILEFVHLSEVPWHDRRPVAQSVSGCPPLSSDVSTRTVVRPLSNYGSAVHYAWQAQQHLEVLQNLCLERGSVSDQVKMPLQVQTWFIDPLRPALMASPSIASVTPGFHDCWDDLVLPWKRVIDASSELFVYIVQYRGLPQPDATDLTVFLVQHPIQHLSMVLFAVFPDSRLSGQPDFQPALVAEPITPVALRQALSTTSSLPFEDTVGLYDFSWGRFVMPNVGPPGSHHGECFGVFPRLTTEPWVGLTDREFSRLLRGTVSDMNAPALAPAVSAPVKISLQASIPLHPVDPASQDFQDALPAIAISEEADWKQKVYDQALPRLHDLPEGMTIPAATYWSLVDPMPLDPNQPSWAEIYVDGSTSTTAAAWSLVVVRTDGNASALIGSLYGQVSIADQCPEWIGATTVDNIAAEFTAFAIALDLACRMLPVSVVIRPDLHLSAQLAAHQCATQSNPKLAQLISVLASWLPASAKVIEVRGHTGHPYNELADAIARWALCHDPPATHPVPILHQLACTAANLDWAWVQGAPSALFQSLPPVLDYQVCQFPLSLRRVPVARPVSKEHDEPSRCAITVYSLNVLALDSVTQQTLHGRQRGQRTARLDLLWHQANAHIIGMQEARTLAGRHLTDHYMIFASGFEDPRAPRFGCEIWIHRSLPLVELPDGTALKASDFKFAILHADPRRLFLRADHAACSLAVTVLHAPCLGKTKGNGHRPIDDIDQWWQETSRIFDLCSATTFHWICVDANAPLASHETDCFALAHAEASNPQGALFEDFLLRHQLAVPATFPGIHQGSSWTWTHSSGSRCRRDYVLVPLHVLSCVSASFTMSSYDGSFCHEGHIPVAVNFSAALPAIASQQRVKWDELAFLDPNRVAQFQNALRTLPLPTWDVRTTDHCTIYEEQVLQLGQQFFGGRPKQRTRPQLQPATISLIAFKRHLLDLGRAWELMTDETFKAELRAVEKVVRKAVHADLACFYDQLLVRLQTADQAADAKQMYRILDRLGRKKHKHGGPRPLPLLKAPDGAPIQSFKQQQQVWLKQFATIEAGVPMTWSALYELCRPGLARSDYEIDPAAFVSPWQLLQAIRKLRRGKACGPNSIPPDLIKAGGSTFAMQLSCLTNKVVAHAHEPTSWRGGKLVPLFKGKGTPHDPSSFRSIFISDFTAKLYHACLRQPLEQVWSSTLHSMQFGGRAGCGVDIPHHFLQMHQCWARSSKKPAAIVFFDMKAAFYSVLRQALTSCPDRNNAFQFAMHLLGICEADVAGLIQSVAQENAVEGVSSHVERLVHDTMSGTFFTIEGIDMPVATHKGTRPGDPIGDLLFNLTMSRILAEMKELVLDDPTVEWFGNPTRCSNFLEPGALPDAGFADVSFVDDCAVAIHATDLSQLQHIAKSVVSAMHQAAGRRGLHLNFEAGKTEMLWHVQGKGSKLVKQQLMTDGQTIQWQAHGCSFALKVVQTYKHLGTWLQSGGCLLREIQTRAQGVKASWGSLARQFFAKRYVSAETKTKVFRALALSRHMFNVHTWSIIKPTDLERWANSIRQPLCSLAKLHTRGLPPRLFDVATLGGLIGMESPQDRLHAARLRYFARLLTQCPSSMWTLIWHTKHLEGAWGALLIESFGWFCKFYGAHWTLLPDSPLEQWILAIQADPSWKGRVRAALKRSCQYRQAQAEYVVWQKAFEKDFYADTGTMPPHPPMPDSQWQCDQCDKWFASKKALATHSQRVHGYRRIVRFFASGDTCPACCKLHHSRMRLCQHLTHSTACMEVLQACFPPMSDEQVALLDQQDDEAFAELRRQGWWRTKALLPACQVAGPLLPAHTSGAAREMLARGHVRVPSVGTAFTQLQGRLVDAGSPVVSDPGPAEHVAQGYVFQSAQGTLDGHGLFLREGLPSLHAQLNISTLVFVHFFSGFRRRGDLHDIISHHIFPDGLQVFALSVDMCLQKVAGDLASDASLTFWKKQVLSGRVFGAGGGPPCETFTSARMHGDGPRVVRTADDLTGIPDLHVKEWRQVLIGTRLVQFILDILYLLSKTGGCGFVEHPQYPVWCASQAPCSLWTFPAVKQLRQLQCVSVVSFDQCVLQAPIIKPTTILLVRLWDFREAILARGKHGRCNHGPRAHQRLIGRDAAGHFRTARGKIYPPHLNQALGLAISSFVQRTFSQPVSGATEVALPEIFQRFAHHDFAADDEVQPDFHGWAQMGVNVSFFCCSQRCKTKCRWHSIAKVKSVDGIPQFLACLPGKMMITMTTYGDCW